MSRHRRAPCWVRVGGLVFKQLSGSSSASVMELSHPRPLCQAYDKNCLCVYVSYFCVGKTQIFQALSSAAFSPQAEGSLQAAATYIPALSQLWARRCGRKPWTGIVTGQQEKSGLDDLTGYPCSHPRPPHTPLLLLPIILSPFPSPSLHFSPFFSPSFPSSLLSSLPPSLSGKGYKERTQLFRVPAVILSFREKQNCSYFGSSWPVPCHLPLGLPDSGAFVRWRERNPGVPPFTKSWKQFGSDPQMTSTGNPLSSPLLK